MFTQLLQHSRCLNVLKLLQSADAFRKPDRFARLLQTCESDKRGRLGRPEKPYPEAARMEAALRAAAAVDAGEVVRNIARDMSDPARIKDAVHQARVAAVKSALQDSDE